MNPYDMPVGTVDQIKAKYEAGGYHGKQYDKELNRAVEVFFWQSFYLDIENLGWFHEPNQQTEWRRK